MEEPEGHVLIQGELLSPEASVPLVPALECGDKDVRWDKEVGLLGKRVRAIREWNN